MATARTKARDVVAGLRSPFPWIALVLGIVLTVLAWQAVWRDAARESGKQFERDADSAAAALRVRMRGYEQMLTAGAALIGASKEVTRAQWSQFVAGLKLRDRYPAIQALGFAERVRPADRARHVARVRAEGLADYDIRPPGERDDHVVIVYSEPFTGRNARVVGLDTYTQPVLRAAIDRSLDRVDVAITEKVMLPGENAAGGESTQPGFVMYLPVFAAGAPAGTKQERDAALQGFVFATFRAPELAAGVLGSALAQSLDIALYDGKAASEGLFVDGRDGKGGVFQRSVPLDVGGRQWTAVLASKPEFEARAQEAIPLGVLAVGLAMSLGLFALTLMIIAERKGRGELSMRDELTQLYNDRYLAETMSRELPRARRTQHGVGLVLIDLDGFKAIQDKQGKECGDQVLRQFAELFEKNTRESDIKCRFAGAQFALGMPGASIENARERAEKLRAALESATIQCAGQAVPGVTLSAGVAAFPQHGEDWASIVQRAHRALYAAKGEGRNRVSVAE